MEVDTDGDAQATYTYGANGLISQKLGSTSYYVGCDYLGSVWDVVTLDTNENVDVSYTHTAFGNTTRTLRQGAADPNDAYRYVGALGYYADADDNHGLLLLGARYYRPSIGRFITLDPIKDGGNWYVYVGNGPVVQVDPLGFAKSRSECRKQVKRWYKWALEEIRKHEAEQRKKVRKHCLWLCVPTGIVYLACYGLCVADGNLLIDLEIAWLKSAVRKEYKKRMKKCDELCP